MKNMIFSLLAAIILLLSGCKGEQDKNPADKPLELPKLTVGIQNSPAMTLVMVAEDKGFFDDAGVDVEIKEFTAGKFALQAFLGGSLDVAVSGEVPVALSILQGNQFRVITQVVERTMNEVRVVAKKEEGIDSAESYFKRKRRKLATSFGGGPEYYTYNFLKKINISKREVELISQKPEDMPAALLSGSVDAISIFDPFARIAEVKMGDKGITFTDSALYSELYVASVMQKTIDERSEALKAFLAGLKAAERFIAESPEEAKAIMMNRTKLDKEIVDGIWQNFIFKPAINQLFIEFTTSQAQWAIEKGDAPASTAVPDFRAVLYPNLLQSVYPASVKIQGQ